jgi:hypothetical protein
MIYVYFKVACTGRAMKSAALPGCCHNRKKTECSLGVAVQAALARPTPSKTESSSDNQKDAPKMHYCIHKVHNYILSEPEKPFFSNINSLILSTHLCPDPTTWSIFFIFSDHTRL